MSVEMALLLSVLVAFLALLALSISGPKDAGGKLPAPFWLGITLLALAVFVVALRVPFEGPNKFQASAENALEANLRNVKVEH